MQRELKLLVPAVKGYRAALNHVFSLAGLDLPASRVISRMFCSFKEMCPLQEVKPLEWSLSLVRRSLTYLLYGPLKLSSGKYVTCEVCFLLVLVSAKRVIELYGLSFHRVGSLAFVTKAQNPCFHDPSSESSWFHC